MKRSLLAAGWLVLFVGSALAQCIGGVCPQPAAAPRAMGAQDPAQYPTVCRVVVPEGSAQSLGTGTLVYRDDAGRGVVITADHVVRDGQGVAYCVFPDGEQARGRVYRRDRTNDVASIVLEHCRQRAYTPIADAAPAPGETVTLAGYGGSPRNGFLASGARLARYTRSGDQSDNGSAIVTAPAVSGDSGGPVLTAAGRLFGVISASDMQSMSVVSTGSDGRCGLVRQLLPPWCQSAPPPAITSPMPRTPAPATAPSINLEDLAGRIAAALSSDATFVASITGPPGPAGPAGDRGPQGRPGQFDLAGMNEFELQQLAAAINDRLPPLRINIVDQSGSVLYSEARRLGEVLEIQFAPKNQ